MQQIKIAKIGIKNVRVNQFPDRVTATMGFH